MTNGVWSNTPEATLTQNISNSNEGFSVSMNADGSVVAVGAPNANKNQGLVNIYQRVGTTWTFNSELQSGVADFLTAQQGFDVQINSTGCIVAVGCPFANSKNATANGGAIVFTRSSTISTSWTINAVQSSVNFNNYNDGRSVAISDDGLILATYAPTIELGYSSVFQNKTIVYNLQNNGSYYQTDLLLTQFSSTSLISTIGHFQISFPKFLNSNKIKYLSVGEPFYGSNTGRIVLYGY